MTLRIYLADLTHTGNGVATEAFPLNIGLVASYAKKRFADEISVELFKYPEDLREALTTRPPHVLGCSNYTWNSNLSYYFCRLAKSIDPSILTVYGGTNYPFDAPSQQRFLEVRPALDLHVYYEGELAFANVVERLLSIDNHRRILSESIDGCQFLDPVSGAFVTGSALSRIRNLDDIPSPYVSGLLDKFFDGHLTSLVETARGCPFTCNFCNAGHRYFMKVHQFSDDYVREELTYIARRAAAVGAGHVTLADNNFGMIPRDAKTTQLLYDLQQQYGWPTSITVWTGKNSKERVIDATRLLGDSLSISLSVQSMDDEVLKSIGRSNIKLDHYRAIADELNAQGRPQHAEVIMPLPGETLASHIHGLNALLDTGVSRVLSHTLQMLHGTPYKDDEAYVRTHGYQTKFRLVPLDFSRLDGEYIFDVEEVAVATSTLSFEDYLEARKYLLVIDTCYNSGVFEPLKYYLHGLGISMSTWVRALYDDAERSLPADRAVFDSFANETSSELWDTEQSLVEYYSRSETYQRLLDYEAGGNVLFKHRVVLLAEASQDWIDSVFEATERLVFDQVAVGDQCRTELAALREYISCTVTECFSPDGLDLVVEREFEYDIPAWLRTLGSAPLAKYASTTPVSLQFAFPAESTARMRDGFRRYGTSIAGIVKLIQRISGVSYTRKVSYTATTGATSTAATDTFAQTWAPVPSVGSL